MSKRVTHHMRPGPIRGSMTLCEFPLDEMGLGPREHYTAELSKRGLQLVDCPSCIHIVRELSKLWGLDPVELPDFSDKAVHAELEVIDESKETNLQTWWRLFRERRA